MTIPVKVRTKAGVGMTKPLSRQMSSAVSVITVMIKISSMQLPSFMSSSSDLTLA